MATEFIGSIVTVTLNQPPNAQVRGLVEGIAEGQQLDLKDVTWLAFGTHAASLSIETINIKDIDIEPDPKPLPPPRTSNQSLPDPAILSFDRNAAKAVPESPTKLANHVTIEPTAVPAAKPTIPFETKPSESIGATATLTEPFTELTLNDAVSNGVTEDQEQNTPARATPRKRRKRRPTKGRQDDPQMLSQDLPRPARTPKRADGWGKPPFLQETTATKKPHPLDAPTHRAEQRLDQARRGRRHHHMEDQNGWATEEATDIQDMGDFDFQGNLSKFDKRGVFEQLRQDDTTADEARLVSFNRLPARHGTNGGRNLHYTENVLDSPQQNGRVSWDNGSGESEDSQLGRSSNGRNNSQRSPSRASTRKLPSRKNSAMVPHDQISSPGFPCRYSSQEHHHPSPRVGVKASKSRYARSESSHAANPSFQLVNSDSICPCVTPLQMLELEQLATSEVGLSDDMMVENAAQCIAQLARKIPTGDRVVILAGNTKSGARAIAAGRQMRNHGMRVLIFVLGIEREEDLLEIVKRQLSIYRNSGGQLLSLEKLVAMGTSGKKSVDLVVDALLGMHLSFEDLRTADQNAFFQLVSWANHSGGPVLAVDVPSGMDAASGAIIGASIIATHVLALGAPKKGLLEAKIQRRETLTWELFVADIGISNSVWKKFGTKRRYGVNFGAEWIAELQFPSDVT
ncbi:MAG: hypothetical protein Q9179_006557 [Wetmoreana sp. 5 TL-2023]